MELSIQDRRLEAGLTLRDIARAMGPGFSPARLSLLERGLVGVSVQEKSLILSVIERLGPLCGDRRRIVKAAREIDFAPFVADLRGPQFRAVEA